ncbi:MAG: flippase-like domain-containing protein [Verrucomicrobiota bacterium]|nr:flippase-like domain-containing protein [Verrucomicrobiota bacterium]
MHDLIRVFRDCDRVLMTLSLGMVVPLTLLTSRRLQQLMPRRDQLDFGEANKLILAASTLNLILPSKMGDIAKAWFMKERGHLAGSLAFAVVVFEKTCDMLSLLLWCVLGLLFYPEKDAIFWTMTAVISAAFLLGLLLLGQPQVAVFIFRCARLTRLSEAWQEMHDYFWSSKTRLTSVAFTSLFIWFLHLLQIWMFIRALNASAPFLASLALSPLAILAGLLPLTFAGVGTRDAALVLFYQPYFAAPTAVALGLLCTARYILPALAGLPFVSTARANLPSRRESD